MAPKTALPPSPEPTDFGPTGLLEHPPQPFSAIDGSVTNGWQARPAGQRYQVTVLAGSDGSHRAAIFVSYWKFRGTTTAPQAGWYEMPSGAATAMVVTGSDSTVTVRDNAGRTAVFDFRTDTWG